MVQINKVVSNHGAWGVSFEKEVQSTVNGIVSLSLLAEEIRVTLTVGVIIKCIYPVVGKIDLRSFFLPKPNYVLFWLSICSCKCAFAEVLK